MAIMRTRSRLSSPSAAPPPSPIPTAKGSRSAPNSLFCDYLNRSLKIPELSLPEYVHRSVPSDVDRHAMVSGDRDSVERLLRSAAEFGIFRISGHGISTEALRSILAEADAIFRIPDGRRKAEYYRNHSWSDEFLWRRFEEAVAGAGRQLIGSEKYRTFSRKLKEVARELECIAEELAQAISDSVRKQLIQTRIQPSESVFSIHRWYHEETLDKYPQPSIKEECELPNEYALSLHLLVKECEFHAHSHRGPLSFNASPDTIVVTVGKQLEEWSLGEFKSAFREFAMEPNLDSTLPSYSIELKCSPSTFNHGVRTIDQIISLGDQILLVFIVILLYKAILFFAF